MEVHYSVYKRKKSLKFNLNVTCYIWLVNSYQLHQKHKQWYVCCLEVRSAFRIQLTFTGVFAYSALPLSSFSFFFSLANSHFFWHHSLACQTYLVFTDLIETSAADIICIVGTLMVFQF